MEIKIKPKHIAGFVIGFIILILDFVLFFNFNTFSIESRWFRPMIIVSFLFMGIIFFLDFLNENKRQKELELKFLEFVRALVETVRSGITVPSAVVDVSTANYGSLTPYIKKLAYQIEWGYPLHDALTIFAEDTKNKIIKKSVAIVIQAERSGGDMSLVLQAVTNSVIEVKKIKEERRTGAYSQIVQGYMIFFIFIITMLVLQKFLLPKLSTLGKEVMSGLSGTLPGFSGAAQAAPIDFGSIFLGLILIQGFFAGLMIGKFSEGDLKAGLKHSLIMMVLGYVVITTIVGVEKPETVAPIILLIGNSLRIRGEDEKRIN